MSRFSIQVPVPDYLAQWLRHEFWNPDTARVEFPRGSAPRAILQSCLTKTPHGSLECGRVPNGIPIEVPTFKGINPNVYRFLPDRGRKALVSCLKRFFASVVWNELQPLMQHDVQISDVIYAFLDRHGIDDTPQNWETVRQMYYRMRKKSSQNIVNEC